MGKQDGRRNLPPQDARNMPPEEDTESAAGRRAAENAMRAMAIDLGLDRREEITTRDREAPEVVDTAALERGRASNRAGTEQNAFRQQNASWFTAFAALRDENAQNLDIDQADFAGGQTHRASLTAELKNPGGESSQNFASRGGRAGRGGRGGGNAGRASTRRRRPDISEEVTSHERGRSSVTRGGMQGQTVTLERNQETSDVRPNRSGMAGRGRPPTPGPSRRPTPSIRGAAALATHVPHPRPTPGGNAQRLASPEEFMAATTSMLFRSAPGPAQPSRQAEPSLPVGSSQSVERPQQAQRSRPAARSLTISSTTYRELVNAGITSVVSETAADKTQSRPSCREATPTPEPEDLLTFSPPKRGHEQIGQQLTIASTAEAQRNGLLSTNGDDTESLEHTRSYAEDLAELAVASPVSPAPPSPRQDVAAMSTLSREQVEAQIRGLRDAIAGIHSMQLVRESSDVTEALEQFEGRLEIMLAALQRHDNERDEDAGETLETAISISSDEDIESWHNEEVMETVAGISSNDEEPSVIVRLPVSSGPPTITVRPPTPKTFNPDAAEFISRRSQNPVAGIRVERLAAPLLGSALGMSRTLDRLLHQQINNQIKRFYLDRSIHATGESVPQLEDYVAERGLLGNHNLPGRSRVASGAAQSSSEPGIGTNLPHNVQSAQQEGARASVRETARSNVRQMVDSRRRVEFISRHAPRQAPSHAPNAGSPQASVTVTEPPIQSMPVQRSPLGNFPDSAITRQYAGIPFEPTDASSSRPGARSEQVRRDNHERSSRTTAQATATNGSGGGETTGRTTGLESRWSIASQAQGVATAQREPQARAGNAAPLLPPPRVSGRFTSNLASDALNTAMIAQYVVDGNHGQQRQNASEQKQGKGHHKSP